MLCRNGKGGAEVRRGGEGEEVGGEEGGRGGSGSSSGAGCCGGLSVLGLLIVREGAGQMGEEVGRRWCGSGSASWCGQRELGTRGGSWAAGVAAGSWVGCHDEARDVAVGPKAAACPRGIIKITTVVVVCNCATHGAKLDRRGDWSALAAPRAVCLLNPSSQRCSRGYACCTCGRSASPGKQSSPADFPTLFAVVALGSHAVPSYFAASGRRANRRACAF